jgi:tetratricopeptide (TPR) repeat protein
MGLFGHLFGDTERDMKELVKKDSKRMNLWKKHVYNFKERERLSKLFNYKNVDETLQNFEETDKILKKIEALISTELVNIDEEEKTDEEILADLEELEKRKDWFVKLSYTVVAVKQKEQEILKLFREIHKILKAELHLIRLIRKKPENVRELLLKLFHVIFHYEPPLYHVFKDRYFSKENKLIHMHIEKIARYIITQKRFTEEAETDSEIFAREVLEGMGFRDKPEKEYRKLGEDIFRALFKEAGAPWDKDVDTVDAINYMEKNFKENDRVMYKIIKKLKPKYDDVKIKIVILAFRKSYKSGDYIDIEHECTL